MNLMKVILYRDTPFEIWTVRKPDDDGNYVEETLETPIPAVYYPNLN